MVIYLLMEALRLGLETYAVPTNSFPERTSPR